MGDTIETLGTYDPGTQRSIAPIDQLTVVPLRDILSDDRSATVLDYIARARDARIIVSERDEVDANVAKLLGQLQHGYEEALSRDEEPLSPDVLFADWAEVAAKLNQGTVVAELGLDDDAEISVSGTEPLRKLPTHHIRCQPAVELHGRVGDLVAEIRKLREAGETTVFVAATAGRAERTIQLLEEYDVLAIQIEPGHDARYAA